MQPARKTQFSGWSWLSVGLGSVPNSGIYLQLIRRLSIFGGDEGSCIVSLLRWRHSWAWRNSNASKHLNRPSERGQHERLRQRLEQLEQPQQHKEGHEHPGGNPVGRKS